MGLKDIDLEGAMRRLADRRIEEAMREGKFDNLPGRGKPLELEPMPADENARLMWWSLRILRNNDFTPDEIRWRKQIDTLKDQLANAASPMRVTAIVHAINNLVKQINTLGTNALNTAVASVDLPTELKRFYDRTGGPRIDRRQEPAPAGERRCLNDRCRNLNPRRATFCRLCGQRMLRPVPFDR